MQVNCWRCGKVFEAQRSTAHYCSVRCRAAAKRHRDLLGYDQTDEAREKFEWDYRTYLSVIKATSEESYSWLMLVFKTGGEQAAVYALRALWTLREEYRGRIL